MDAAADRHLPAPAVITGIRAGLAVGSTSPELVAVEGRRAATRPADPDADADAADAVVLTLPLPASATPNDVWVPITRSPHTTCTYSWTRPPSRSRRSGRTVAPEHGGAPPAGGR